MTIDEAINILECRQDNTPQMGYEWIREAQQLGIEALKRLKTSRDPDGMPPYLLLPGETRND